MTETSPPKRPSKKKSKFFEARKSRNRGSGRKSVRVSNEDVIWYSWLDLFLYTLLGGMLGYVGSFVLWLGLALTSPIFSDFPYTLLAFEVAGVTAFTLLAALRNRLLKVIVSHGFALTFFIQRAISWTYDAAILLALYDILSVRGVPGYSPPLPSISPALAIVLIGLYFWLIIPRFVLSRFLWEIREARLSLLQFLAERAGENPRYSWLRRGMQGVEQQLRNSGLGVAPGILFHGASYSLFRQNLPEADLLSTAEWLIHPARFSQVNSIIPGLIWESKQSEEAGFGKAPGILDRFVELPWQRVYRVTAAAGVVAGSVATIIAVILTILKLLST